LRLNDITLRVQHYQTTVTTRQPLAKSDLSRQIDRTLCPIARLEIVTAALAAVVMFPWRSAP